MSCFISVYSLETIKKKHIQKQHKHTLERKVFVFFLQMQKRRNKLNAK